MKHVKLFEAWDGYGYKENPPISDIISPEELEMKISKAFSLPNAMDAMIAARKIAGEFFPIWDRAPVKQKKIYTQALKMLGDKAEETFNKLTPEEMEEYNEMSGRGERLRQQEKIKKDREELEARYQREEEVMSRMPKRIQDLKRDDHLDYKEILNAWLSDELTKEQVIEIMSIM